MVINIGEEENVKKSYSQGYQSSQNRFCSCKNEDGYESPKGTHDCPMCTKSEVSIRNG
jgi:hypothetical protein